MQRNELIGVGGGPCGLIMAINTALKAKKYNQPLDIYLYEKYNEYQRKHVLDVENNAFAQLEPELKAALEALLHVKPKKSSKFSSSVSTTSSILTSSGRSKISTSALEETLLAFAARFPNIIIQRGKEILSCTEIKKLHPNAKFVMGADGSHSLVRKEIFNSCDFISIPNFKPTRDAIKKLPHSDPKHKIYHAYVFGNGELFYVNKIEGTAVKLGVNNLAEFLQFLKDINIAYKENYPTPPVWLSNRQIQNLNTMTGHALPSLELSTDKQMQQIAEIKYRVQGKTRYLNAYPEQTLVTLTSNHFVSESVSPMVDGETQVALRAIIDLPTYNRMAGVTFKTPLPLNKAHTLGPELYRTLFAQLAARIIMTNEQRLEAKITKTMLSTYVSSQFALHKDGTVYALFGDSALGVPFFNSFNFHCKAAALCSELVFQYACGLISENTFRTQYNGILTELSNKEWLKANINNTTVHLATTSTSSAQKLHRKLHNVSTTLHCDEFFSLTQDNANFKKVMNAFDREVALERYPSLAFEDMSAFIAKELEPQVTPEQKSFLSSLSKGSPLVVLEESSSTSSNSASTTPASSFVHHSTSGFGSLWSSIAPSSLVTEPAAPAQANGLNKKNA